MTLAVERDLAAVAAGITTWLATRRGVADLTLTRCERPTRGSLQRDAHGRGRGTNADGPYAESLVVRLAPADAGIFPEYDLAVQARAQEVAAASGVPAPAPAELRDRSGVDRRTVPRHAGDRRLHPGPDAVARPLDQRVGRACSVVSRVASSTSSPRSTASTGARPGSIRSFRCATSTPSLAYWTRYLEWYADGDVAAPMLHEALAWCEAHRPAADPPPAFLWGDVRLGNIIFDEQRNPVAVLDWEMTTIGAPEHDLAWYLTLEWIQNELFGAAVPGFLDSRRGVRVLRGAGRPVAPSRSNGSRSWR